MRPDVIIDNEQLQILHFFCLNKMSQPGGVEIPSLKETLLAVCSLDITGRAVQVSDAVREALKTENNTKSDVKAVLAAEHRLYKEIIKNRGSPIPKNDLERNAIAQHCTGKTDEEVAAFLYAQRKDKNVFVRAVRTMRKTLFKDCETDRSDCDILVDSDAAHELLAYKLADPYDGWIKSLANRKSASNTRKRDKEKRQEYELRQQASERQIAAACQEGQRREEKKLIEVSHPGETSVTVFDPKTDDLYHICGTFCWARTTGAVESKHDERWLGWNSSYGVIYNTAKREIRIILLAGLSNKTGRPIITETPETPSEGHEYNSALVAESNIWLVHEGGITKTPLSAHLRGDISAQTSTLRVLGGVALAMVHEQTMLVMACESGILVWPSANLPGVRCLVAVSFLKGTFHRQKPLTSYASTNLMKSFRQRIRERAEWCAQTGGPIPVCSISTDTVAYQQGEGVSILELPVIGLFPFTLNTPKLIGPISGTLLAGRAEVGGTIVLSTTDAIWTYPGGQSAKLPECQTSIVVNRTSIWRDADLYTFENESWTKKKATGIGKM